MTQEEQVRDLVYALRRCFRFLHNRSEGGKDSRLRVLRVLHRHQQMTQRQLLDHMAIQQSTLSELLKKMEEDGLLRREPCPEDRRQVLLCLTEAGCDQLEQMEARELTRNVQYLQVLSWQERETLLALLTKLDAAWTEQYPRKDCRCREGSRKEAGE